MATPPSGRFAIACLVMYQESPDIFVENQFWLIEKAAAAGYRITKGRLSAWHRAGLLPKPKVFHRKGKVGSETVYPAKTLSWLLLLCQVRREHRSIRSIGWNLFLMGLPVHAKYWRPALDSGNTWLKRYIHGVSEPREKGSEEHDILESGPDEIRKTLRNPVSVPLVGDIKKYFGVDRTADFLVLVIDALLGNFEKWDRRADEYLESDRRLLSAAFASVPELDVSGGGIAEVTAEKLAQQLHALSELKLGPLVANKYRSMTEAQLLKHAGEFYIVISYLIHLVQLAQNVQPSPLNPERFIPKLREILSSGSGSILYLLSLAVVEIPSVRNGWDGIVEGLRGAAQNRQFNTDKAVVDAPGF